MSESRPNNESYRGPFGPAELIQCPPDPAGDVQLAEHYNEPGLDIEWENHSATEPGSDERQAIIRSAGGDLYYLHGDTLYDVQASQSKGELISFTPSDPATIPALKLGEAAAFTRGDEVAEVTVATDKVRVGDPILSSATQQSEDPFTKLRHSIDNLPPSPPKIASDPATSLKRIKTPRELGLTDDFVTEKGSDGKEKPKLDQDGKPIRKPSGSGVPTIFPFAYARVNHPNKGGEVVHAKDWAKGEEGDWNQPEVTTRHGRAMSPGVPAKTVENPDGYEYKTTTGEDIRAHIQEAAVATSGLIKKLDPRRRKKNK